MSYVRGVGRGLNVKNVKIYGKGNSGGTGMCGAGGQRAGLGVGVRAKAESRRNEKKLCWWGGGRAFPLRTPGKERVNETVNFLSRWVGAGCRRKIRGERENKGEGVENKIKEEEGNKRKGGKAEEKKRQEERRRKQEKKRKKTQPQTKPKIEENKMKRFFYRGNRGEKSHVKRWLPGEGSAAGRGGGGWTGKTTRNSVFQFQNAPLFYHFFSFSAFEGGSPRAGLKPAQGCSHPPKCGGTHPPKKFN